MRKIIIVIIGIILIITIGGFIYKKLYFNLNIQSKNENIKEKNTEVALSKYVNIDTLDEYRDILYKQKNFDLIEAKVLSLLSEYQNPKVSFELMSLYNSLTSIEDSPEEMQVILDEWCENKPYSHIPFLVRGGFNIDYAWYFRGSKWAKSVQKDAWPKFYDKLEIAQKDLEKSFHINPNDPNSSSYLIIVAMGLNYNFNTMEAYFKNSIKNDPYNYSAHLRKLNYLKPKWHGSMKEMLDFAEYCRRISFHNLYLNYVYLYAYREIQFLLNPKKENILGNHETWSNIQNIFTSIIEKYPDDLYHRFSYAYYAYNAKKYEIAASQFDLIDYKWSEHPLFKDLKSYNEIRVYVYNQIAFNLTWNKKLYSDALPYYKKALECDPNNSNTYYGLGINTWYLGEINKDIDLLCDAKKYLMASISNDSHNSKAKTQLDRLEEHLKELTNYRK